MSESIVAEKGEGSTTDAPYLDCPECGKPLIPASGRGQLRDGEYMDHRDGCRCPYCHWVWLDDGDLVTCSCGAVARVALGDDDSDEGPAHYAYAELVESFSGLEVP